MIIVAKIIKAPFFYVAGRKSGKYWRCSIRPNCCSSIPILAPVGVLLAVLGYAVGTYGAYACIVYILYYGYYLTNSIIK
jgi:hypothetical protein